MGTQDDGTGGKYRVSGTSMEESAAKSAKWSGEEMDELASEEEADTAEGAGEVGMTLMVTERNRREAEHNTDQGVQRPAEAPPLTQPPRKWT